MLISTISRKIDLLKNYVDHEQWFVLYTRSNFEKIIDKKLKELGFYSFLPLRKELRHWNERKVWIETPVFKSYIFIKTKFKKKDQVFKIAGILNYVRFESQLAILSEEEINKIKQLCFYKDKITIEYDKLETGKKMEICEGVLKGLKGFLTELNGVRKIRLYIESLNCFACITMDLDSFSIKYIS